MSDQEWVWVSGMDLTQRREKREGVSGQVGNEYSVRNVSTRHKGVRGFRSVLDASGSGWSQRVQECIVRM